MLTQNVTTKTVFARCLNGVISLVFNIQVFFVDIQPSVVVLSTASYN